MSLTSFCRSELGVTALEYGLVAAILTSGVIAVLSALGDRGPEFALQLSNGMAVVPVVAP